MIPSKINKRHPELSESPQLLRAQSNLQLVSKASSIPKQFQKCEKLKTIGNKTDSIKHSKNNSMNHLSTCENTKITDSIQNVSTAYMSNKAEEIQLRNEIKLKSQLINDLNHQFYDLDKQNKQYQETISQLDKQNMQYQETISQLESDIKTLNETIENMCEQLQQGTVQFENLKQELNGVQAQNQKKEKLITQYKQENQQLLNIIKQGSYQKQKEGKENDPAVLQKGQQDQINQLKEQMELQKKQFNQTEVSLQKQISGLNQFLNEMFQQSQSDRFNNNTTSRIDRDLRNRKISLQNDMEQFSNKLQVLEKEKCQYEQQQENMQTQLNVLTEKQLSNCLDKANLSSIKEISKLKKIVQIQKKQIDLQQKTILNQHFEIQSLQTLLYKNDQDSVCENQVKKEYKSAKKNSFEEILTNQFDNSPKDRDEIYHLNDSQSDIKPKFFLDSIQNTFQKYQVITEESTFRN